MKKLALLLLLIGAVASIVYLVAPEKFSFLNKEAPDAEEETLAVVSTPKPIARPKTPPLPIAKATVAPRPVITSRPVLASASPTPAGNQREVVAKSTPYKSRLQMSGGIDTSRLEMDRKK